MPALRRSCLALALLLVGCGGDDNDDRAATDAIIVAEEQTSPRDPLTEPSDESPPDLDRMIVELGSPDAERRHRVCTALARYAGDASAAVPRLRETALHDPDPLVRIEAASTLTVRHEPVADAALMAIFEAGETADPAWKQVALELPSRLDAPALLDAFERRIEAHPEGSIVFADALRRLGASDRTRAFALRLLESPDDAVARATAETIFTWREGAADLFAPAVKRVMPSLHGHGRKLRFAQQVGRYRLPFSAAALAGYLAETRDLDDRLAIVEVMLDEVPSHHQRWLAELRATALDTGNARLQQRLRELITAQYADQLTARVGDATYVYRPILTRGDALDWEVFHHQVKEDRAVLWAASVPRVLKIPALVLPLDQLVLDAEARVLEIFAHHDRRGFETSDPASFILVLPAGAAARRGVKEGDVIEFDRELVGALSEF